MYDADRYDAEILLERSGACEPFDTKTMCKLFNCHKRTIHRATLSGRVPPPANPCSRESPHDQQHEWSREQVIDLLLRQVTMPRPKYSRNKKVCFV